MGSRVLLGAVLLAAIPLGAAGAEQSPGRAAGQLKLRPFDLRQVRLLPGPCADAMERNRRYLLSLDSDRQLHTFRCTAGLPSTAKPLGGWESPGDFGRGEFFGHCLSACAMLYAATGDEKLKAKTDYLVAELAKCQDALGPSGYVHAEPESYFDRLESGQFVQGIYYTVHKLMAGLLDVHACCGNRQALEVATKLARWVRWRSGRLTPEHWAKVLEVEFGGLNEALMNLYAVTGDPEHLATARRFDHEAFYRPLAEGRDALTGLHANTNIPKVVGAARAYELTGEARYRRIAEVFWRQVALHRSYCTGGTSNDEHWRTAPGRLAAELSHTTQECCCTYNMLKLTRHVLLWTADPRAADYYERALFNGILGTQNPENGLTMYYVALASGYWKTFASPLDSFWCCTGTGAESFAKLAGGIYFHDDDGLWINLFIASELAWPEKGLRVRQETRFPEAEDVSLIFSVKQPIEMTIHVRVPYWATRGVKLRINGADLAQATSPSSYAAVRRTWADGDRLEIAAPMGLHACPMPDDKNLVAVMLGPLVLAGRLGAEGLTPEKLRANTPAPEGTPVPATWFVVESDDLTSWIKPVPGRPLEFRTRGQAADVTLVPLSRLFGERYAVYWNVYRRGSPEHQARLDREERRRRQLARSVDAVQIGDAASEAAHALQGERTESGSGGGRHWRHATAGGWFSYRLAVLPDRPMSLQCTYWGGDVPPRAFDVLVDGRKIAAESLDRNKPGEFFEVEHSIPREITQGKRQVVVRFQAHPGNIAGGLFGLSVLKPEDRGEPR